MSVNHLPPAPKLRGSLALAGILLAVAASAAVSVSHLSSKTKLASSARASQPSRTVVSPVSAVTHLPAEPLIALADPSSLGEAASNSPQLVRSLQVAHHDEDVAAPHGSCVPASLVTSSRTDAQLTAAVAANLQALPDTNYATAALPAILNKQTPQPALDALMADLQNRPEDIKLPTLVLVAQTESHPFAADAQAALEAEFHENFGQDWSRWEQTVTDQLNRQRRAARQASCRTH